MPAQGDQQAGNSPVQGNNAAVSTSEASGPDPATSASISASELPAAASVEPVTQYIVYYTGNPVGTAVAPTVTNAGLPETITFDATATTSFIVDKATVTANHTFKIVQPAAVIFRPKATGTVPLTTSTTQETAPSTTIATSTAAATTSVASVSPTVIKNVRTFYSYDIVTVGNDSKTSHVANPWSSTMLNPQGSTVFILFTESPAATLTATTGGHSNAKRLATLTSTVLPPGAFTQIAAFDLVKSGGGTLSAGAGAGIGIACAIVGALIAFGVFFCFFRRKKSTRSRSRHLSKSPSRYQDNAYNLETKAPSTVTTLAIPHDSGTATVFNNKPQPKEDAFIADEFSRLKSRIDGHVNSYYLRSGGSEKASLDALAHIWSAQSPIQLNRLPGLLADSRSRSHVLRAAIAWVITKRILPNGPLNESFLPAEVSASYAALTNNRMDVNTRSAFLSEWRVLTTHLSSQIYGTESFSPEDPRLTSIQSALRQADMFLAPLASSVDHEARLRNLEEIMKRAARFGWTLFSQPSEFEVDWADEGRGVVVFPGLVQVSDENGCRLRQARSFGQKEVVPM